MLDAVGHELELPHIVSLVDYPAFVARLKALAIEAGFVLHEGNKEQRASDGVWAYVLRCECYKKKANRCPFSFKLTSGPVEVGSDPESFTMEAGVDLHRGHNHDLPTPGAKKQQSAGYIDPFVKAVVAAAVKIGIPTGKTSALLAHLGRQKTYGNNELESLRQRTTRQLQDAGFGEIWETLEQIQSAGSLPGLHINRMVNASNEIVAIYVMTPLGHLLRQRYGAVVSSDVTYNTNQYAFYLAIQTVYLAAIGRRAPTSFALIRGQTTQFFAWLLQCEAMALGGMEQLRHSLWLVDQDEQMMAALHAAGIPFRLCWWHLARTIQKHGVEELGDRWPEAAKELYASRISRHLGSMTLPRTPAQTALSR